MLTNIVIFEIIISMNINLDDKLVAELDSIFENKRTNQVEWDACIEDIVEEYIARHNGTWEELPYEEEEENDDVHFDLRGIGMSNGKNGVHNSGDNLTKPPFKKDNLQNRLNDK